MRPASAVLSSKERVANVIKPSRIIVVNGLPVEVVRKRIKNLHLRVFAPADSVRVSAPLRVRESAIRELVLARFEWIRDHQLRLAQLPVPPRLDLCSGELHSFFGRDYRLALSEGCGPQRVVLEGAELRMSVRPGTDRAGRVAVLNQWYRQRLKGLIPERLAKWEAVVGVRTSAWGVKQMKTRWGTCNVTARRIWLNLELAKQPPCCLDYIIVHELVHLLERRHNARFHQLVAGFLPQWREADRVLRRTPLRLTLL